MKQISSLLTLLISTLNILKSQPSTKINELLGRDRNYLIWKPKPPKDYNSWKSCLVALDGAADDHSEAFGKSLQQLLLDLPEGSEIEVDLLSKLVLACGDVSLESLIRIN